MLNCKNIKAPEKITKPVRLKELPGFTSDLQKAMSLLLEDTLTMIENLSDQRLKHVVWNCLILMLRNSRNTPMALESPIPDEIPPDLYIPPPIQRGTIRMNDFFMHLYEEDMLHCLEKIVEYHKKVIHTYSTSLYWRWDIIKQ